MLHFWDRICSYTKRNCILIQNKTNSKYKIVQSDLVLCRYYLKITQKNTDAI